MPKRSSSAGRSVYTEACDVTDQDQVKEAVQNITRRFGRIDVLVNNAGSIQVGPMELMGIGDYEEMMKIHFWAPLYTTLAVFPQMRQRGEGRIVNISSIGGKITAPHLLPGIAPANLLWLDFRKDSFGAVEGRDLCHDRLPRPDAHRQPAQREFQGPAPEGVRLVCDQ